MNCLDKKPLKWDPQYLWKFNLENWYDYVKDIRVDSKPICCQNIISETLSSQEIRAFIDANISKLDNLKNKLQKRRSIYGIFYKTWNS